MFRIRVLFRKMGLAEAGTPLSHEDTMKWANHVREHGIIQFINLYNKQKTKRTVEFKWGDEIEYSLVKFDKKNVKLSLRSVEVLEDLNKCDTQNRIGLWTPEWGAFMIEGTPAKPYQDLNFTSVEKNMQERRKEVQKFLKDNEQLMCLTSFPRMGCENFTYPLETPNPLGGLTKSHFFPDACIFPGHPRYQNTTKNIMGRRGEKPFCNLPIFIDKYTKIPVDDSYKYEKNALPDHIYLDTMGFGCAYSCLQVTFQASDIHEARHLYDQMAPFCSIMMALTAASPFHRGFISDVDTRWSILCNTQDCRTKEEKGLEPLRHNKFVIKKSRHDSIDCYISEEGHKYNDKEVPYHEDDFKKLINNGVDEILAQHIAHLFIRDTISLFEEKIHQNDEEETDHFENIQSTVWQSVRFKPPPPNSSIGWRVEFRPCDVQTTDFENAAVSSFLALLTRVILKYKLNFLIPISKVDENVQRAQKRNAVNEQKFWFRRNIFKNDAHETKIAKGIVRRHQNYNKKGTGKFLEKNKIGKENSIIKSSYDLKVNAFDENEIMETYHMEKRRKSLKMHNEPEIGIITKNLLKSKSVDTRITNENFEYTDIAQVHMCGHSKRDNNSNKFYGDDEYVEMSINEIINGKDNQFIGIVPLMQKYLNNSDIDLESKFSMQRYLRLISGRASGEILTIASWMRQFALRHPDYKNDSVVTEKMNYDLLKTIQAIQNKEIQCPELLGDNFYNSGNYSLKK